MKKRWGILNFFGVRVSGFNRQNRFFAIVSSFVYSKYIRYSIAYFFGAVVSGTWLLCSMCNVTFVNNIWYKISENSIPIKFVINKLVDFPMSLSEYISQNKKLKSEAQRLKLENDELRITLNNIKNVEQEVIDLKKSVKLRYSLSAYRVIEKVLGFDKSVYESFVLISVTHGAITIGSVVISSEGIVGIVHDISGGVARVMHVCDSRLNIPVRSESGGHAIVSGNGDEGMVIREIKERKDSAAPSIKEGDMLFTSGEGGIFHRGIPVARVKGVVNGNLAAVPVVELDSIGFVWIIDPIFLS